MCEAQSALMRRAQKPHEKHAKDGIKDAMLPEEDHTHSTETLIHSLTLSLTLQHSHTHSHCTHTARLPDMLVEPRRRERRGELHPQRAQTGAKHTAAAADIRKGHQAPAVCGRGRPKAVGAAAAAVHGLWAFAIMRAPP
jgi:hypothetical protein